MYQIELKYDFHEIGNVISFLIFELYELQS